MQITIPATADGTSGPTSVLDLKPLIHAARLCRADGIRLLPPVGADDLPNGAALLAMKQRLERADLQVAAGFWRAPADADVADPAWQTANLFEARALLAALGEADVSPLTLLWDAPAREPLHRAALCDFLAGLLEEAERAGVGVALRLNVPARERDLLLRDLDSARLGVCWELDGRSDPRRMVESLGEKLFAALLAMPRKASPGETTVRALERLRESGFSGPLHVSGPESAAACAYAVGWVRGVLAER